MPSSRRARSGRLSAGDNVRVDAHVGTVPDLAGGEANETRSVRGEEGQVIGANPRYKHPTTGETMVSVQLHNGAVIGVPERALRRG